MGLIAWSQHSTKGQGQKLNQVPTNILFESVCLAGHGEGRGRKMVSKPACAIQ